MDLDGFRCDEERLGDVAVGHSVSGHLRDPPLARREGLEAGEDEAAWARAGGDELGVRALGERFSTAAVRELESLP